MPSVVFSENAESDLESIVSYTKELWGSAQAASYVSRPQKQTIILAKMPTLGKFYIPYKEQGVRVFLFEKHLIYYMENQSGITIIHTIHKAMEQSLHINPKVDVSDNHS